MERQIDSVPGQHQPGQPQPRRTNERTIMVTCSACPGARGYCNLRVTRIGDEIMLDPHVADGCVIIFDEAAARELFALLREWLG